MGVSSPAGTVFKQEQAEPCSILHFSALLHSFPPGLHRNFWNFITSTQKNHQKIPQIMDLVIKMLNGTTRSLRVQPQDTVRTLKQLICQTLDIQPHNQRLVYENGNRLSLDDDTKRLCDYGLQSGSQLSLLVIQPPTIQVFLKNEKGQTTTYEILADETVSGFKAKVQAREGVQASQQRLIHEGKEMAEGNLSDYNVRNLSTIFLTFRLRGGSMVRPTKWK